MIDPESFVIVGKVLKHRGAKGYLTAKSFCVKSEYISKGLELYIETPDDEFLEIKLEECKFYNDKIILKFLGYDNSLDISKFIGKNIYIKRKFLPPLKEDEFYWTDVLNMEVVTTNNENLGRITDILETGANDVLVISNDSKEVLIPAIRDVIKNIDYNQNSILVELIEGLR